MTASDDHLHRWDWPHHHHDGADELKRVALNTWVREGEEHLMKVNLSLPAGATMATAYCDTCKTSFETLGGTFSHECFADPAWRIEPIPAPRKPPRRRPVRAFIRRCRLRLASWVAGYDVTDY